MSEQGNKPNWVTGILRGDQRDGKGRLTADLTDDRRELLAMDVTRFIAGKPLLVDEHQDIHLIPIPSIAIPSSPHPDWMHAKNALGFIPRAYLKVPLTPDFRGHRLQPADGSSLLRTQETRQLEEALDHMLGKRFVALNIRAPRAGQPSTLLLFTVGPDEVDTLTDAAELLMSAKEMQRKEDQKDRSGRACDNRLDTDTRIP